MPGHAMPVCPYLMDRGERTYIVGTLKEWFSRFDTRDKQYRSSILLTTYMLLWLTFIIILDFIGKPSVGAKIKGPEGP